MEEPIILQPGKLVNNINENNVPPPSPHYTHHSTSLNDLDDVGSFIVENARSMDFGLHYNVLDAHGNQMFIAKEEDRSWWSEMCCQGRKLKLLDTTGKPLVRLEGLSVCCNYFCCGGPECQCCYDKIIVKSDNDSNVGIIGQLNSSCIRPEYEIIGKDDEIIGIQTKVGVCNTKSCWNSCTICPKIEIGVC